MTHHQNDHNPFMVLRCSHVNIKLFRSMSSHASYCSQALIFSINSSPHPSYCQMPCCLWYNPWLCHLSQWHFHLPYNPNLCHPVHSLHQQESTANISLSHLLITPSMSFPLRSVSSSTI